MTARRILTILALLHATACDGADGPAATPTDTPDAGAAELRSDLPGELPADLLGELLADLSTDLEPAPEVAPGEILETQTPEIDGGGELVESSCHTDCFGGILCRDGVMLAAATYPIPCWVDPDADCFDYGEFSWPCVSGVCAEHELCQDDQDHLASLVPADAAWLPGTSLLAPTGGGGGDFSCSAVGCEWTITGGNDLELLHLVLPPLSVGDDAALEGTTQLWASVLPIPSGAGLPQVGLYGAPAEATAATVIWAPYAADYGQPGQGLSGALILEEGGPGGDTMTIVWRVTAAFSGQIEYAIEGSLTR